MVGNPVRAQIAQVAPPEQRDFAHGGALRLLVLGGSQGARALNNAVPQAVARSACRWRSVHQAGEKMLDDARKAYADAGVVATVEPFIADMAAAYAHADLVVCRAGALTLAELCAVGVGSVLVPFPQAVDDHQTRNAEYLVERGAALAAASRATTWRRACSRCWPTRRRSRQAPGDGQGRARAGKADAAARVADAVLATIRKEAA
jgi:UDP-N-acetylglucosamine--N-acetylmuramyl-(pentapeptide) pyrophosphoryl-undecaprenol N-acetylglucosamine transferase